MLPFALKVAWFCFSFSGKRAFFSEGVSPNASAGIIACWVVQCVFSQAIGSYWGPVLYSIFATLLEGIICLGTCVVAEGVRTYSPCAGMIYDMDPYRMPKTFCIRECQSVFRSITAEYQIQFKHL